MMEIINIVWLGYGLVGLWGWYQNRRNPFGLARGLTPLGAFVWGDGLIIGIFWIMACGVMLILNRADLFGLVWLIFWWVRAMGEVGYWLNEQFISKHRNKPKDLWGHELLPGEAIYFGYQLFWQMVMVGCSLGILWKFGMLA